MHLAGKRILITRAAEDCDAWAVRLRAAGAVPLTLPCIECESNPDPALGIQLAETLPQTDWLVLTSRRGADALGAMIASMDPAQAAGDNLTRLRIAVVGPATAAAAAALPGRVDLIAPGGTARSLAATLAERINAAKRAGDAGKRRPRCLIAVAKNAGTVIEESLERAGADWVRLDVYRTVPARVPDRKLALSSLGADKILLASPSAVTGLVNRIEFDTAAEILTIGPSTSRAVRAAGLAVAAEAPRPGLDGLMEAMQ